MAHLGRTNDAGFDLALGFGILDGDQGSFRKRLGNNQHGSAGADRVCIAFESIRLADDLNHNADPEEGALRAAALFGRGRTRRHGSSGYGDRFEVR